MAFRQNAIFVLLAIVGIVADPTIASNVKRVDVYTSDCDDCDMNTLVGSLSVKLCGNGPGACCLAENLDNPLTADFTKGEISTFTGSTLGECNGFDMGAKIDWANAMTIYHSGLDGAQFDSVVVYTQDLVAKCYFYKFLEGKDSEHGTDCTVVKMNP